MTGRPGHRRATLCARVRRLRGRGLEHRRRGAARRLRTAARRYAAGWHAYLGRLAAAAQRRRTRAALRRLGDGAGRRSRTRPTAARASRRRRWRGCGGRSTILRALPPRVVARPLPGGHRADRGRRPRGRGARARLPVDAPAGRRRMPPAEHARSTASRTGPACSSTRSPTRSCSPGSSGAATPETWRHVERAAGVHPRAGPDLAGALGERRRATRPRRSRPRSPRWCAPPRSPIATATAAAAASYRAMADEWQAQRRRAGRARPTARSSTQPYYLRAHHGRRRQRRRRRTRSATAARRSTSGPSSTPASSSSCGSASSPPTTPTSVSTLPVVDRELGVTTPNGQFWHRYNYDGYGETPDGGPVPGTEATRPAVAAASPASAASTSWPSAAPVRAARRAPRLRAIAATANDGLDAARAGLGRPAAVRSPGLPPAPGTLSATPLGWTHAQFIRLAWSIDAGRPVERPRIVACRYAKRCR